MCSAGVDRTGAPEASMLSFSDSVCYILNCVLSRCVSDFYFILALSGSKTWGPPD